ncbi:GNAT family N-acetyltransferase [Rothia uropygioeca]|uniref:GNAT family N-acetyltransferase n=1 Tax=Kocuria sp. 257 TaxID=2021970 RepID=UPI001012AEC3|nr:GNAT family N-acetyltransferase [Kocuria sp. 257]
MTTTVQTTPNQHSADPSSWTVRPVDPATDSFVLTEWLRHPASYFWQMQDATEETTRKYLADIAADDAQNAWMICDNGQPIGYAETYDPARVLLAEVFDARQSDVGMHLLVAPPPQDPAQRRSGLTSRVMRAVVDHCVHELGARRLVVEPDVRNRAVEAKNREVGFRFIREIDLPGKTAALSIVEAEQAGHPAPDDLAPHLHPEYMEPAQRHVIAKALAEFSHEHLIHPEHLEEDLWELSVPGGSVYRFCGEVLYLNHWSIDEASITRHAVGSPEGLPLNAQEFVAEMHQSLGIPEKLLGTYLEELASTLASAAFKNFRGGPTAGQLAHGRSDIDVAGDFQQTEAAMTEGHPCFVATNGRIGFGLEEFRRYAPEAGSRFRYVWVAAHREDAVLEVSRSSTEDQHWASELSLETRQSFTSRLTHLGLDPEDYVWIPVHPWQFQHRISISFAPDIASRRLVVLGEASDEYQPQQSIRTAFNRSTPSKSYIKTALSIQNMGFLRGLSPAYMRATPAINDWVADLVRGDELLREVNFDVLREHASIGYTGDAYHATQTKSDQQKMLAALWRESPLPKLDEGERILTMASLLHRDVHGRSVIAELIKASGTDAKTWLREYLTAYLTPVLHCLEAHDLAFMPHGENLILRMKGGRVIGAFMKDIGEEAAIIGERALPEEISRMRHVIDDAEASQLIFTDVFVGVLRHIAGILHQEGMIDQVEFWTLVRENVDAYRARGLPRRRHLDLEVPEFRHSCLNRLQLRNTLEMVDLQDASGSLIYTGSLKNPIG